MEHFDENPTTSQLIFTGKSTSIEAMPATLFLIFAAILYRVVPAVLHLHTSWTENFSPLASIVLCGALFFPKKWAVAVPLVILVISDVILNAFAYHAPLLSWEILPRYIVLGGIGFLAFRHRVRLRSNSTQILGSSLVGSAIFYLVTNAASWVGDPAYFKTVNGLVQSLTIGVEGYPPSYLFLRNSLASDLLFTGLFLVCMAVTKHRPVVAQTHTVAA